MLTGKVVITTREPERQKKRIRVVVIFSGEKHLDVKK